MKKIRLFLDLALFILTARNSGGFGIHSPLLFRFVKYVLKDKNQFYIYKDIEKIRIDLLKNQELIRLTDFGTGTEKERSISDIAKKSLKSKKYTQLFFRIINEYKFSTILELGTSLGVTSQYLAASNQHAKCVSIEGCPETANVALNNIKKIGLNNLEIKVGEISKELPKVLIEFNELDFVFIDANHKYESVLSYFEQCVEKTNSNSIIVIDDIYWSKEMKDAWKKIKQNNKVTSSIDLFQIGIVFFNPYLQKKHYKIIF